LAVVSIAAADGISIREVVNRGRNDLILRLAFADWRSQEMKKDG
jgi:hypothetical protein